MNSDIVISVRNLTKKYKLYNKPIDRLKEALSPFRKKYHQDFTALNGISFDIKKGEIVGIIGKNGSGKSTLLKLLTGVLTPSSGLVKTNGKISALLELGAGFNPDFTGIENVYFNGSIMGFSKAEMDKKIDKILEFADIGEFAKQPVKMYSSGMYVRLAFSLAINVDPDILIVDEALAVGDAMFQHKCYVYMQKLFERGTTVLLVTHNTDQVKLFCNKAIYLKGGKIEKIGNPSDVIIQYMQDLFPQQEVDDYLNIQVKEEEKEIKTEEYCYYWNNSNQNKLSYGKRGGKINSIKVFGLNPPNIFPNSGTVRFEIMASWDKQKVLNILSQEDVLQNIYLGFTLVTKQNIPIFGSNTFSNDIKIDPLSQQNITVIFEIEIPPLQRGDYFITVALSLGTINKGVHLEWNEFTLQLISDFDVRGGLFLPKTKVRLK